MEDIYHCVINYEDGSFEKERVKPDKRGDLVVEIQRQKLGGKVVKKISFTRKRKGLTYLFPPEDNGVQSTSLIHPNKDYPVFRIAIHVTDEKDDVFYGLQPI